MHFVFFLCTHNQQQIRPADVLAFLLITLLKIFPKWQNMVSGISIIIKACIIREPILRRCNLIWLKLKTKMHDMSEILLDVWKMFYNVFEAWLAYIARSPRIHQAAGERKIIKYIRCYVSLWLPHESTKAVIYLCMSYVFST